MREGISRTASVVRWLSFAWPVGMAAFTVYGERELAAPGRELAIQLGWVLGPAIVGFFASLLLDSYAELGPDRSPQRDPRSTPAKE
jgi:hypothetical protein